MTRPISNDLRERIIGAVEGGMSCNAAAKVYDVAISTVIKLVQRWKATGSYEAMPMGGYRGHKLSEHTELVQRLVKEKPDITLAELRATLKAHKIKVGQTSIFRFLNYLNLSSIKKTVHASEQGRPDVQAARVEWGENQPKLDPARLVFIDETGASTNMARRYGRCPIGERLLCKEPWEHWKTVTFTGALRLSGMTAPMILDGAMDGDAFRVYVRDFLAPTLHKGDIVIMDNLPSHKVSGIREAIEAVGAKLHYLPPYSPDLNPIEQAFSKIKAMLRKTSARSLSKLLKAIALIIRSISPTECAAYLNNSRYCV